MLELPSLMMGFSNVDHISDAVYDSFGILRRMGPIDALLELIS